MDEFVRKFSVYDLLARVITGGLVMVIAYFSGLLDTYMDIKDIPVLVFLLCAYGTGLVLEELSYILNSKKKKADDTQIFIAPFLSGL